MSSKVEDDSANALLIQVENFNNATNTADERGTYLRLGAVPSALITAYDDVNAGNGDGGAFTTANGEDLASQVLTFIDDTRERGTGDFYTLTEAERQTESELLHTKGGWRDHTDGNRISTTRGDKVEVIGGNYKLLVLGREQWNNDAGVGLHHESSGGITYHYDEVPGQIIDVRRKSDGTTWSVIEECNTGHFVARYHGVSKEWHRGGDVKLRVGSLGAYKVAFEGASWDAVKADHGFKTDTDFDKPNDASHQAGVDWPGDSDIPSVIEEVFANTVTEKLYARKIHEIDGTSSHRTGTFDEKLFAKSVLEINTFTFYEQKMSGTLARETWEGWFLEVFLCVAAVTIKFGLFLDLRCGYLTMDLNLAGAHGQLNLLGKRLEVDLSLIHLDMGKATVSYNEFRIAPLRIKAEGIKFEFPKVQKDTGIQWVN